MMNVWSVTGFVSSSNRVGSCSNGLYYLGAPGLTTSVGSMSKSYFGFTTHSVIYFNFAICLCGVWQSADTFSVQFDGRGPFSFSPAGAVASKASITCGSANVNCLSTNIAGKILHTSSSLTFKLSWSFSGTGSPAPSLAIKDFSMSFGTLKAGETEGVYITLGDTSVTGSTQCIVGSYYDTTSSSCKACNSVCYTCFGPTAAHCYRPPWNGFYDGTTAYTTCNAPNCYSCYGTGTSQCTWCSNNLNPDGTCSASCTSPLVSYGENIVHVCLATCSATQYMSWNNTCFSSCNAPLVAGTDSKGKTCSYPCGLSTTTFLYWDGSCQSTCPYYTRIENYYQFCDACQPGYYRWDNGSCLSSCYSTFSATNVGGSLFCKYPCTSSQYLYANSSCISTCQALFSTRTEGSFKFCNYPCTSSQYLYANSTCMSSCQSAFVPRTEGTNKFCDYPCSSAQFLYANGSCISTCQSLFTPRTEGTYQFCTYPCASGQYLYLNGSCITSCQTAFSPRTEGTYLFCTYPCASGQYLYANGSCVSSCQVLFNKRTEGTYSFCDYPCASGQYLYANGTCMSSCQSVFIPRTEGTNKFCDYPCTSGYLYANGSCLATCQSVFIPRTEGTNKFCDYPCPSSQYLYANGTCMSLCQSVFIPRTEGANKFCDYPCTSSQYLYANGTCISTCQPSFSQRTEGTYKFCDYPCTSGYLYPNGSCIATCQSLFSQRTEGTYKFCTYPCASSQYLYQNSTCATTCQNSFTQRTEGTYQFCTYPCASSQYLYPNGTCIASCQTLFAQRTEGTYKFCTYPCASDQHLYANGSCISTCQPAFSQRTEGTNKFCDYPCASGKFLYANGTCISTCQSLFNQRTEGTFKFCDYPCSSSQYLYANGTCLSCLAGFTQRNEGANKFCDYPCTSSQFLYQNGSCFSTCGASFVARTEATHKLCDYPCPLSQYLYANSSCLSTCEIPYAPKKEGPYMSCNTICKDLTYFYYPDKSSCDLSCDSPYVSISKGLCQIPAPTPEIITGTVATVAQTMDTGRTIVSSAAVLATLLSSSNPSSFFMASLCKFPYYTKHMNLDYSDNLKQVFASQTSDEISPKGFFKLQSSLREKMSGSRLLAETHIQYNINSSFLINFFPALLSLLIVLSIGLYAWVIRVLIKNKTSIAYLIFDKIVNMVKWNFFFGFSLYYYDGLIYYTSLELKAYHTSQSASTISIIVCLLVNLGAFAMIGQAIRIVLNRRKVNIKIHAKTTIDTDDLFDEKYKAYKVVYEPFKDQTLIQQGFYVIYSIRIYLYFVIFSYLLNYPIAQTILMLILSIATIACLVITKPLKSKLKFVQYTVQEAILLMIGILIFITAALGKKNLSASSKETIGYMIIACYFAFLLFSSVMMMIQLVISIMELIQFIKSRRGAKPVQDYKKVEKSSSRSAALELKTQDIEKHSIMASNKIDYSSPSSSSKLRTEDAVSPSNFGQSESKSRPIKGKESSKNKTPASEQDVIPNIVVPESKVPAKPLESQLFKKDESKKAINRRMTLQKRNTITNKQFSNEEDMLQEVV